MKMYNWSDEKNQWLRENRDISFEDILKPNWFTVFQEIYTRRKMVSRLGTRREVYLLVNER